MNDMAISPTPEPAGQAQQTTPDPAGLRRSALRQAFDALAPNLQAGILDEHRNTNTHHDWWDSTYDEFKSDMDAIGIYVDRIYFSGFWSQGDGACFEGKVHDWDLFLRSVGLDDLILIKLAQDSWKLTVNHRGHYYHEHCTDFDYGVVLPHGVDDEEFASNHFDCEPDGVEAATRLAVLSNYDSCDLETQFVETFRSHMRDLYRRLEAEHDHLTSDEAVLETLEANDMLEDAINDAMEEAYA